MNINKYIHIILFTFAMFSCSNSVKEINNDNLRSLMKENESFVLIDVRTQEEYDQEHISGAKLIPLDKIEAQTDTLQSVTKDSKVVLYCRSGKRSNTAAIILKEKGYSNLQVLKGGIKSWNEGGQNTIVNE